MAWSGAGNLLVSTCTGHTRGSEAREGSAGSSCPREGQTWAQPAKQVALGEGSRAGSEDGGGASPESTASKPGPVLSLRKWAVPAWSLGGGEGAA